MNIKKRQEVEKLLPWYNLGKLSTVEKAMVDKALLEDTSLKEQISLDNSMRSAVLDDPTLLDQSALETSSVRLDKLLAKIDTGTQKEAINKPAPKEAPQTKRLLAGVKSFFTDLLSGSSESFTYAVFAALAVVQLTLLMFFVVPSAMQDESYVNVANVAPDESQPLVNNNPVSNKDSSELVLLIAMKDNISFEGFTSETFGELKFDLLPNNYGFYRVRLNKKLSPKEIEVLKNELSHKSANILFVGEEIPSQ
ncbi:MAG: hypothetical protein ACPG47_05790 [Leucothrix sp.]